MIPTDHIIILSTILFAIGVAGMLFRRNAIIMLMSVELMLNAANLALLGYARAHGDFGGQVFVLFIMTVAAAEVAVGLALLVLVYRTKRTINTDNVDILRW